MNILERYESIAGTYVRNASIVFEKAEGAELFDETGARYIDFQIAGGSVSYGHNSAAFRAALVNYLSSNQVIQTCDRMSVGKRRFLEEFVNKILRPRNMNYKILFVDPASGMAAEMALRLARRNKNRASIVAFTNSSHGLTDSSLLVSGKRAKRSDPLVHRSDTAFMPFCGYFGEDIDTSIYFRNYLEDSASGVDLPAAVIVETVQVQGGVHIASTKWLTAIEKLCREFGLLFIVDDSLTGCGRCGSYFSFEQAGINPDMVVVSNAVAGGLPLSMLLLRPELDQWCPGEQAGAFQGNSLAFVAGAELLTQYGDAPPDTLNRNSEILAHTFHDLAQRYSNRRMKVRGTGMIWGLEFERPGSAAVITKWALEQGVIVEPARNRDEVLLVLPPVTIQEPVLREGLDRLEKAVHMFLSLD